MTGMKTALPHALASLKKAAVGQDSHAALRAKTADRFSRPQHSAKRNSAPRALLTAVAFLATFGCGTLAASDSIRSTGDILQYVLPATAIGLTIGHKDGDGALQFGESFATTLGVTYTLKYTINAQRPNGGDQSFPSGHTSTSFASAEFMRKRYGWEYGVPAYVAASFVAYSRVESDQHYTRDVVAGAAIGILSSYLFTKPYDGWQVGLEGDLKGLGIRLSRTF